MTAATDDQTPHRQERRRLRELLSLASDDGLTPEVMGEIERLLKNHPDLLPEYVDCVATESVIESSCGLTFLDAVGATPNADESEPVSTVARPAVGSKRRAAGRLAERLGRVAVQNAGWLMAACLLVALSAGVAWWATPPIATVVATRDAVPASSGSLAAGDTLGADWIELESGSLRLALRNGVMASIDAPARFRPRGDNSAEIAYGAASFHVPEAGHGFRLVGSKATVTDLGTGFRVVAGLDAAMAVHVTQGAVELANATQETKRLDAGDSAAVDSVGAWSDIAANLRPATSGQMRFVQEHPKSLGQGHYMGDNTVSVFLESYAVQLPYDLRLDNAGPGDYLVHGESTAVAKEGDRVHCYLLHSAPRSERHEVGGRVRFAGRIIGILCEDDRLNATNEVLGARWTLACQHPERGAESAPDPNFDRIIISPDRRELSAHFRTMSIDQVRVLVAAD